MGSKLQLQSYHNVARKKGLLFMGEAIPQEATIPVEWLCPNCGKTHHKSFRSVADHEVGCRCQRPRYTLQEQAYRDLAAKWNLEWVKGPYMPVNTKQKQTWILPNGERLEASYSQIAYETKPAFVKKALGLPYRERRKKEEMVNV